MKETFGDLLSLAKQGMFDVVVHGCNCFCTMGAGVAKAIKNEFPEAYAADLVTVSGDPSKLGGYSKAQIEKDGIRFVIVNAYTQYDWRGKGVKADYDAIKCVFAKIKADFPAARIGYPLIGAGLAGGDWTRISEIIDQELWDTDHTLVRLAAT